MKIKCHDEGDITIITVVLPRVEREAVLAKLGRSHISPALRVTGSRGRAPAPIKAQQLARKLRSEGKSLRGISGVLATKGYKSPSGQPYSPGSIQAMLREE